MQIVLLNIVDYRPVTSYQLGYHREFYLMREYLVTCSRLLVHYGSHQLVLYSYRQRWSDSNWHTMTFLDADWNWLGRRDTQDALLDVDPALSESVLE